MKFFVESSIALPDLEIFFRIREAVLQLPDDIDTTGILGEKDDGQPVRLSCHILARAVAQVFGLEYRDGFFSKGGYYIHSWLITCDQNVIDVYPVGILGGPLLVDSMVAEKLYINPKSIHYTPKLIGWNPSCESENSTRIFSELWFTEAVRIVVEMLNNIV